LNQRATILDGGFGSNSPSAQRTQQTCLDQRTFVTNFSVLVEGNYLLATERFASAGRREMR
jgi:hypothetical protein